MNTLHDSLRGGGGDGDAVATAVRLVLIAGKHISEEERKALPLDDFGDPDRRLFPVRNQEDLNAAEHLVSHAADPKATKKRLIAIAKRKGLTVPDSWQTEEEKAAKRAFAMAPQTGAPDGTPDDFLVAFGSSVKVKDGKIEGYLVSFSDPDNPDVDGEYFTKQTFFGIDFGKDGAKTATLPAYYSHGFNKHVGKERIGWIHLKMDDRGLFMTTELDKALRYRSEILGLAEKGVLGASSGAVAHLVVREEVEGDDRKSTWLKQWPLGEGSLTVSPAEPRNVLNVKEFTSAYESAEKYILAPSNPRGGSNASYRPRLLTDKSATLPDDADFSELVEEYFGDSLPSEMTMQALYSLDSCRSWGLRDIFRDPRLSPEQTLIAALAIIDSHSSISKRLITAIFQTFADDPDDAADQVDDSVKSLWLSPQECAAGVGVPASLSLAEQTVSVLAAVDGLKERMATVAALRVKDGRALSKTNHERLTDLHERIGAVHTDMQAFLCEMKPGAKPKTAGSSESGNPDDAENEAVKVAVDLIRQHVENLGVVLTPA